MTQEIQQTHKLDLSTVGKRLRYLRDNLLHLSRPKMAEIMGIPPTTLKNYELGYRDFGSAVAQKSLWSSELLQPYALWITKGDINLVVQRDPIAELKAAA